MVGQAMDRLYEEEALCPVCLHKERVRVVYWDGVVWSGV